MHPQWKVGAYRIDMVIKDGVNRVALECDGEKWHTLDNLADDLRRQAILERLGWRFIRIRGSAFYRNPEETMKWVYKELGSYNIKPNYSSKNEINRDKNLTHKMLLDSVKRRAQEIRVGLKEKTEEVEDVYLENN